MSKQFALKITASFTIKKDAPYPYKVLMHIRNFLRENPWVKDLQIHSQEANQTDDSTKHS